MISKKMSRVQRCQTKRLNNLAHQLKKVNYSMGDTIIKQGDVGDLFYMIDYGSVAVHVQKGAKTQTVADLTRSVFWRLALLNNEPRAATVVATENTCLFYLSKEEFLSVLQNVPELGKEIRNSYMFAG